MKSVFLACLLVFAMGSTKFEPKPVEMSATDVLDTIGGLLKGLAFGFNVEDIVTCLQDLDQAGTSIVSAVKDFEKEDVSGVTAGLKALGTTFTDVSNAIPQCESAYDNDAKVLEKELAIFKSPLTLVYTIGHNLVVNGNEIYSEVNSAISAYKTQNWEQFGFNIGEALGKVLGQGKTVEELINSDATSTWTATTYERFENMTDEELSCFTGLMGDPEAESKMERQPREQKPVRTDLPTSFDARTKWADCIHPIRDQQQCGSCWAFAGSEAISDRFCIASNGKINEVFSPQDLVSCSWNMGCNGGNLYMTWLWMESFGIALDSCVPYTSGKGDNGKCSKTCTDGSDKKKAYVKFLSIEHLDSPDAIKTAVYETGPIETGFTVYKDFMSYKSGIYKHTTGDRLGGHAVKIVGWGEENGEEYWIVANSWNTTWGEDGFFKIAFGQCGIDADGISGTPNVSDWEKNNS